MPEEEYDEQRPPRSYAGLIRLALVLGIVAIVVAAFAWQWSNIKYFVAQMEKILTELEHNRDRLERLRRQGIAYVRERLTWDAKAQSTTPVLNWAAGRGLKPDLGPPKTLCLERST